jgi:outer membrane protein OmpA-like peptidoglycan-associated protein
MRLRWIALAGATVLSACGPASDTRSFSVYFQPYSADLDQQARESAATAAQYAAGHASLPVSVAGYSAPSAPVRDVDVLSAKRAEAITRVLVADGVSPKRITVSANGSMDPHPLPEVSVRRVDITVGQVVAAPAGDAGSR